MEKLVVSLIVTFILFSSNSLLGSSPNGPELNSFQGTEQLKLNQEDTSFLPSILRIGVMTPAYVLENYDPLFDPIAIGWNYDYRRNSLFYEALVHYNPNTGALSPALATQWVVSEDSKHWTFYLREDAIFHDGSRFNASSVKYNFERLFDQDHPAYITPEPYISHHTIPFESIEIQSEYQVTIHLKKPFAALIVECSYLHLASPSSFNGSEILHPIGTGPYVLNSTFFNDTFENCTFTRFSDYYQGLAPFEEIHYLSQEEFTKEINAHTIDMIFLYNTIYEQLKTDTHWTLNISKKVTDFEIGYINHQREHLNDPRVRLAINYAIDRQDYITRLNWTEFAQPMTNLIPPGVSFHNSSLPGYPYNVTLANEILDAAGYPRGEDNYRFLIQLVGPENRHPEIIGEYLDAIGIWPFINPSPDWAAEWREGNYDILLFGSSIYHDPDLSRLFLHSSSPLNTGGFDNSQIDQLVTNGSQTPIRQEREYFYNQLQPIIQETAPFILLTYNNNIYAMETQLSPYINVNKVKQIYFNYSYTDTQSPARFKLEKSQLDEKRVNNKGISTNYDLNMYSNIEISAYPLYFPHTDCVMTPLQQQSYLVNITMSHELNTFLPSQKEIGKYIRIASKEENNTFRLRCYYDVEEVQGKSHEQLALLRYDEREKKWEKLTIVASNATFRYLEVELKGRMNLIRFNEGLLLKTFRLVPFFAIAIGGLVVSALSIVIYNFRKTKYIKGRILK